MYRRFYGLTRNPFELSPDPYFYYPTALHNEAFATLNYCVVRRKGFVVVTGEVGTGKTLLLRCLLDALNRNDIASALVNNPRLSVSEFLAYLLTDLRVPLTGRTKGEMLSQLNNYLLVRSQRGTTTVLVVDEAHLLSWELLEEMRLLTNFETSQHKLLQIVLVGQPELDRKIDSEELRQLKQRIAMRCRLEPLGLNELRGYIHRRLELAGANSHGVTIFSDEAIEAIHRVCCGIPRLANTLCENSLISAYGRQAKQVTADMVREVAADLRLNLASEPFVPKSERLEERRNVVRAMSK
jgi:general secretion pathway protein A